MYTYSINKFGLFKRTKIDNKTEWECLELEIPVSESLDFNERIFEAPDDDAARLIYEVGGYE